MARFFGKTRSNEQDLELQRALVLGSKEQGALYYLLSVPLLL
jgi:hypothetical protein